MEETKIIHASQHVVITAERHRMVRLRTETLDSSLHVCQLYSSLTMNAVLHLLQLGVSSKCWFSPSDLNCESNKCSLCLRVRLC